MVVIAVSGKGRGANSVKVNIGPQAAHTDTGSIKFLVMGRHCKQ